HPFAYIGPTRFAPDLAALRDGYSTRSSRAISVASGDSRWRASLAAISVSAWAREVRMRWHSAGGGEGIGRLEAVEREGGAGGIPGGGGGLGASAIAEGS